MAKKFWNGQNKEIIVEDVYVVMVKMAHQQIFDEVWENFVNWGCSPNIQIWLIEQMIAEWGKTEAEISTQNVNLYLQSTQKHLHKIYSSWFLALEQNDGLNECKIMGSSW